MFFYRYFTSCFYTYTRILYHSYLCNGYLVSTKNIIFLNINGFEQALHHFLLLKSIVYHTNTNLEKSGFPGLCCSCTSNVETQSLATSAQIYSGQQLIVCRKPFHLITFYKICLSNLEISGFFLISKIVTNI